MNRPIVATASPSVHAVNSFFHVLADAGRARRARTRARTEARPTDLSARPPDAGGPPRCTVVARARVRFLTRIAHTAAAPADPRGPRRGGHPDPRPPWRPPVAGRRRADRTPPPCSAVDPTGRAGTRYGYTAWSASILLLTASGPERNPVDVIMISRQHITRSPMCDARTLSEHGRAANVANLA